jgi:hypothetical protein
MFDRAASFNFSGRDKKFCYCPQCPAMLRIQRIKYVFLHTSSRPDLKLTDLHLMPMLRMCEVNFHWSTHLYDLVINQAHGIHNALTMLHKRLHKAVNCTQSFSVATSVYCLHVYAECSGQNSTFLLSFCKIKTINSCVLEWLSFNTRLKKKYSIT